MNVKRKWLVVWFDDQQWPERTGPLRYEARFASEEKARTFAEAIGGKVGRESKR